ncbi:MAG TPA: hypothetical protein VGE14_16190 [Marmoricola sp.]
MSDQSGSSSPVSAPALISVRAPLDPVRAALVGSGATAQHHRSVVFDLGEDLIVIAYDGVEAATTIAVGGEDPWTTAKWLAQQLDDFDLPVETVLPPMAVGPAHPAPA